NTKNSGRVSSRRSSCVGWRARARGFTENDRRMASYVGHLTFSSMLGAAAGGFAAWQLHLDWGPVFLGAGLTTLGGLLPDLDSDSGVPVREVFGLAAAG